VDKWPQVRRLLTMAATVYGRSYVPNIFLGVNPHGPSDYYVAVFSAFFTAPQGGDYAFATVSSDASYLEVDGRVVAEWLGRHDAWAGARAEHRGAIRLAAGAHRLQYVQIQFDARSAAVAAWKPPGQRQFEVMPPGAFVPVARFRAASYEPAPGATNALYFDWRSIEHNLVDDLAWVKVRFRVLSPQGPRTHRWSFDDGTEASGTSVEHLFVRPGNRQVSLEVLEGSRRLALSTATVRVEPHWPQIQEWRPELFAEQKRELLRRELQAAPLADLVAIARMAARTEDDQLLARAAQVCLRRQGEFNSTQADLFYALGARFVGQGDRGDELAEKALRVALPLSANSTVLHDKVRLRLAALLLECGGNLEEAQSLLKAMSTASLSAEDRRLRQLLLADALAAQGEVDKARAAYQAVGARLASARKDAQVKRLARLEGANHLLRRGELDDAERILRQMESDDPLERLGLDTGLPLIRVYLARGETRRALAHCQRRAPTAAEHLQAPELYYALAEAGFAAGQTAPAQAALRKLLRDFPYSEAAARAKESWPTQAPKAPKP
jgi:tetratricopeptide (TPR) repeat protein